MKNYILLFFLSLIFYSTTAQSKKDTVVCTGMQGVSTRSTIESYPFNKVLHISKESLKNGFTLISSDTNWKVDGFWYTYDCEGCDIYRRFVLGKAVNTNDHFIFKKLRKRGSIRFHLHQYRKKCQKIYYPEFFRSYNRVEISSLTSLHSKHSRAMYLPVIFTKKNSSRTHRTSKSLIVIIFPFK